LAFTSLCNQIQVWDCVCMFILNLWKTSMISIRATEVNLVIKKNSHQQFEKDEALDHIWPLCFAKEMRTGNIKTNTSLWVSSRKIKDLLNISLWNNLEKKYYSGRNSNLKLDKCALFKQKKKNILFYIYYFIHICVKSLLFENGLLK
jgi:hypothetical protein